MPHCAFTLDVFVVVHVYSYSQCCLSLFLSTHQPGVWRDSLGTDVNKLCLRKSQIQNVCEHNCIQPPHVIAGVSPLSYFLQELAEKSMFPVYTVVSKMGLKA